MFTGIVEEAGVVVRIHPGKKSTELYVRPKKVARTLRVGSSIAVNGACLTVVAKRGGVVRFDVLNETLRCTNFGELTTGSPVNLERPLRADGRLDGHFVQGHVDATGVLRRWEKSGADYVLEVTAPPSIMRYVVEKGSIAIDGISLTVAALGKNWVRCWIIPHTRAITNLLTRQVGQKVNLEADMLAKHLEKFFAARRG
jgi:riboflavin synthase